MTSGFTGDEKDPDPRGRQGRRLRRQGRRGHARHRHRRLLGRGLRAGDRRPRGLRHERPLRGDEHLPRPGGHAAPGNVRGGANLRGPEGRAPLRPGAHRGAGPRPRRGEAGLRHPRGRRRGGRVHVPDRLVAGPHRQRPQGLRQAGAQLGGRVLRPGEGLQRPAEEGALPRPPGVGRAHSVLGLPDHGLHPRGLRGRLPPRLHHSADILLHRRHPPLHRLQRELQAPRVLRALVRPGEEGQPHGDLPGGRGDIRGHRRGHRRVLRRTGVHHLLRAEVGHILQQLLMAGPFRRHAVPPRRARRPLRELRTVEVLHRHEPPAHRRRRSAADGLLRRPLGDARGLPDLGGVHRRGVRGRRLHRHFRHVQPVQGAQGDSRPQRGEQR